MATAIPYIAQPILKIDGKSASDDLVQDILQISVEESLHLPSMFTLVIKNDRFPGRDDDAVWKHQSSFAIGKSIEIGFISAATESDEFDDANQGTVLNGEITAIETHFTRQSQAPIIIRGYDTSHRLHRGRQSRSFQNKSDSDIVNEIAKEVGISTNTVDSTGGPYGYNDISDASGYVFQQNQTNMEFLRQLAARNGYELFVQDDKLNFRKPAKGDTLTLEWLKDLHSFRVRVSSAEQIKSVEVRGWDYSQKKVLSETISSASKVHTSTDNTSTSSVVSSLKPTSPAMVVVNHPFAQSTEAKTIAQGLYDELSGEYVSADAKAEGNPKIRPGKVVKLSDMGNYSGTYYVTETRHLFHERIYTTEFSVRGLRGGDLLQTLSPPTQLQPGQTCLVGIVADNNDPKGWGRVRVKFPTLTEDHMSYWARVVSAGAGTSRGLDCLPEINDEVLVAFEHGDIHRPYIVGGVWNGSDAPPEKPTASVADGKVRLRTFKTRTGHSLQFVEEDKDSSKKGVYVDTVYGHQVDLNDSEKKSQIKTKEGHYILFDDSNKKIEIKTNGGHKILLDDSSSKIDVISKGSINVKSGSSGNSENIAINGGNITLKGSTGITLQVGSTSVKLTSTGVTISGATISVKATGINTISGSMVKLN